MNKELYVSSTPHETKVALMEDDQLAEVFFERENEYTLAGSIYKGRVTRVLPGMQSAFVDIGLERDAFLYVSDFLELTGDEEEDEEFGAIPAPRGTIEVGKPQAAEESRSTENQTTFLGPETDEETETFVEDFSAPAEEQSTAEGESESSGEDRKSGDGARRWRGRRRRGGRRGRGEERDTRVESAPEPAAPAEEAPRARSAPPPAYAPMMLPGESISKYRNLAPAATESAVEPEPAATAAVEDFTPPQMPAATADTVQDEVEEEAAHLDQGFNVADPEPQQPVPPVETAAPSEATPAVEEQQAGKRGRGRWGWRRKAALAAEEAAAVVPGEETANAEKASRETAQEDRPDSVLAAEAGHDETAISHNVAQAAALDVPSSDEVVAQQRESQDSSASENTVTSAAMNEQPQEVQSEHEVDTPAGSYELSNPEQLAAPSVAPEGRTLEHEVLEDEEAEFQPVPSDLGAMSEVAGDEELVLEEETLDSDDYSDRWVPKIADVDEDEVLAAEMRGEKIYAAEEEGEDEEENGEEEAEETNGRAELRASASTAGYQQRNAERPAYGRRNYRDRGGRGGSRRNVRARPNNSRNQPLITDLLKEGQEVLIQIAKEPIGKKGARITSHIALPGRFLVYMPTVNHIGVSRKIASDEERQRLKRIVGSERENGQGGFIVRTAASNIKEEDLRADIRFLKHLWSEIKNRADNGKSPALIYHDLNLVERVLRDQVNADFSQIWVDAEDEYERVVRFANRFQPSLVRRIKLYTKDTPLFEQFGIQDEINRSLKSKVWLKSGGHIVINQTEALVAIDVNTGKYVGKTQRLEDTIVKTNVDAIKEIVRQIRLRDLGGIIVIDFIDMDERKNRQKVMMALEEALRNDRAPSKVLQFNDFGLVAITRKRVKQSLERTLAEPCPYCTGAGFVKSVPTVCNELYIEMRKMVKVHDKDDITLRVNPEVAKALKANNGKLIGELEELTGKTVLVKSDPALHQEMFDIH
ncbi:MAG: Rne/Rng family ribonuclease [Candidatus Korobacteraceae bacterium]